MGLRVGKRRADRGIEREERDMGELTWRRPSGVGEQASGRCVGGGADRHDESGRGGAGAKKDDIPHGYPRRPRPLSSQLVFLPSPFLSVIVVIVSVVFVVVVIDARMVAMLGTLSGSVGVGALVEQDASAAEIVDGAREKRRQWAWAWAWTRTETGSGRERLVPRGSVDSRSKEKEKETSVHVLNDASFIRASAEAHRPLASLRAQRKESAKEAGVEK